MNWIEKCNLEVLFDENSYKDVIFISYDDYILTN